MHRRNDHATSVNASSTWTQERLTEVQGVILDWFRKVREATDEELEDALKDRYPSASTLRKRRGDLVRLGHLRDSGRKRVNRNNVEMKVWELAT